MTPAQQQLQLGKIFRRPNDGAKVLRMQFVSGDETITVKLTSQAHKRLVDFVIEHAGDIPEEARTKPVKSKQDGADAASGTSYTTNEQTAESRGVRNGDQLEAPEH